ncbi:hypothetical protein BDN67DRAFT_972118 [Paxillus ammoniavirescens]|nr:hypothetical protein BDN67DRAFT_972118 [Paxillus ammoniavirescens]
MVGTSPLTGRNQRKASISDLPFELLLSIFTLVYQMECLWPPPASGISCLPLLLRPSSTSFPYNMALVCTAWRSILSTQPSFWTRVFVVARWKSVASCKSLLAWSQNLPLDIFIHTASRIPAVLPDESIEAAHIDALRKHLAPRDIFGDGETEAPLLNSLHLGSTHGVEHGRPLRASAPRRLSCPHLYSLVVDGTYFWRHWIDESTSLTSFSFPNLRMLNITNYKRGMSMGSMLRVLKSIPRLDSLYLQDINFDNRMIPRGSLTLGALKTLVLSRLSPGAVFMIFHALCPHEEGYGPFLTKLVIEACQVNFVCVTGLYCDSLSLVDIPDGQDLGWILKDCDVDTLTVIRCPAFNDSVLKEMTCYGDTPLTVGLTNLCIKDCINFSPRVLREMYDTRRELNRGEPSLDPNGRDYYRCLRQLSIAGDRPEFSQDDQTWLDKLYSSTEPTSRYCYVPLL